MTWKVAAQVFLHGVGVNVLFGLVRSEHIPWQLAVLIGAWVVLSGLVAFLQGWEAGES